MTVNKFLVITAFLLTYRAPASDKPKVDSKPDEEKTKLDGEKNVDKDRNKENKRSRSTSPRRRRRDRSPTPKPLRIHIGRLTRNVNKEHINEIFSVYGTIKAVEFPNERAGLSHLHRGFAYIEFSTADEAENAMKHMDGGKVTFFLVAAMNTFLTSNIL